MFQTFELPKAEEFFAPIQSLNALAVSNMEKLVALQTKNFEKYSALTLANIKEASSITDLEQSKEFFEKQAELSKKVSEELTADAAVVAEIGKSYAAEVQALVTANVEKAVEAAAVEAPVKKAAPRTKKAA